MIDCPALPKTTKGIGRMIYRHIIRCPGCTTQITVRLSVRPTKETKFYFPCPSCSLPITGEQRGKELDTFSLIYDDTETFRWEAPTEYVVTVDPDVPVDFNSKSLRETRGGPNLTLLWLLRDRMERFVRITDALSAYRDQLWPKVSRMYEYYLENQWDHFASAGKQVYGEAFDSAEDRRDSLAYRALTWPIITLCTADPISYELVMSLPQRLGDLADDTAFYNYATTVTVSGAVTHEQRRTWDCIRHLINAADTWIPGMICEMIPSERKDDCEQLQIWRNEFDQLRDTYISTFETCCKSLVHIVAMINITLRGDPDIFDAKLPDTIANSGKRPPRSLAQFKKLSNRDKIAYTEGWPEWGNALSSVLDNRLRNALGHNSVRHDLRTGMIKNDNGEVISYLNFTRMVYRLNTALLAITNALHWLRTTPSSQPSCGPSVDVRR